MGFADYFLIVWDFVHFAKSNGIGVGPGRGSAAGSLVAYALRITDLDPIRYDLLFERFLNPGRKSMPDIDIDFSVHGRERVMDYVTEKYGRERVAQIITFGKLAAKAATRDAGRVMGLPFGVVDRIAKLIPEGVKVGFDDCLKPGQDLQTAYDDPASIGQDSQGRAVTTRQLIDMARPLEGLVRQDSIHAAAVVIGDRDLSEYLPLQQKGADEPSSSPSTRWATSRRSACSRWTSSACATSTSSTRPCGSSRESAGIELDLEQLPLDDRKTYEMLARGDATGRVPVRVERHARRAAPGEADRVRRPHRARRAVPAGPDGEHPGLRAAQERQASPSPTSTTGSRPPSRARTASTSTRSRHADRQVAGRVHARRGRRPAQGDRQEDRRR